MVIQSMQTLTDWIVLWWMIIALYQFFDYVTDELVGSENLFHALIRIGKAALVIPVFPILKVFSSLLMNIVRVKLDEAIEQED